MPGAFRIGRIADIDIEANVSWLVILVLLTFSLAVSWFPAAAPRQAAITYWVLGFIAAMLHFASVLLHELAHSLVATTRGLPVKSITLFLFGGVSYIAREPQSPGVEFQIAIVGPLTSLVIGGVSLFLEFTIGHSATLVSAVLTYLGVANLQHPPRLVRAVAADPCRLCHDPTRAAPCGAPAAEPERHPPAHDGQ